MLVLLEAPSIRRESCYKVAHYIVSQQGIAWVTLLYITSVPMLVRIPNLLTLGQLLIPVKGGEDRSTHLP